MTRPFPTAPADVPDRRPHREALAEAVLQDFIDDLPVPLRPTDLATRLLYPRWQVYSAIEQGGLIAERVRRNKRLLKIDAERNRAWIARGLATRRARAGSGTVATGTGSPVTVVVVDPEALDRLEALTATGLSVREAVEYALTALGEREALAG